MSEVEALLQQVRQASRELGAGHAETRTLRRRLADELEEAERYEEALQWRRTDLQQVSDAEGPGDHQTLFSVAHLCWLLVAMRREDNVIALVRHAREQATDRWALGWAMAYEALAYRRQGDVTRAREIYLEALALPHLDWVAHPDALVETLVDGLVEVLDPDDPEAWQAALETLRRGEEPVRAWCGDLWEAAGERGVDGFEEPWSGDDEDDRDEDGEEGPDLENPFWVANQAREQFGVWHIRTRNAYWNSAQGFFDDGELELAETAYALSALISERIGEEPMPHGGRRAIRLHLQRTGVHVDMLGLADEYAHLLAERQQGVDIDELDIDGLRAELADAERRHGGGHDWTRQVRELLADRLEDAERYQEAVVLRRAQMEHLYEDRGPDDHASKQAVASLQWVFLALGELEEVLVLAGWSTDLAEEQDCELAWVIVYAGIAEERRGDRARALERFHEVLAMPDLGWLTEPMPLVTELLACLLRVLDDEDTAGWWRTLDLMRRATYPVSRIREDFWETGRGRGVQGFSVAWADAQQRFAVLRPREPMAPVIEARIAHGPVHAATRDAWLELAPRARESGDEELAEQAYTAAALISERLGDGGGHEAGRRAMAMHLRRTGVRLDLTGLAGMYEHLLD